MLLIASEIDWKHEAMKRENRKPRVFPPPDDGREWILIDDAAETAGVLPQSLLKRAKRENWTRTYHHHVKTWLLKKDFDHYLRFIKDRERWYNQRRPKNWQPDVGMNPREEEALFKRIFLTTAQAAAYMGIGETTILKWVRQGKIPVFLTRKKGRGGRNWYSLINLRNLKESEAWQSKPRCSREPSHAKPTKCSTNSKSIPRFRKAGSPNVKPLTDCKSASTLCDITAE